MESFGLPPKRDAKSEKEKQDYEKHREAYAKYYRGKYRPGAWGRIFNENDQGEFEPIEDMVLKSGPQKLENGIYRRSGGKGKGVDLYYKDGQVIPCVEKKAVGDTGMVKGGITSTKQFREVYGQTFDFLGANGVKTVSIDWEKASSIRPKKVIEAMKLANERGQTVEFGPQLTEYLTTCSQKNRDRILGAQKTLIKNQRIEKILTGYDNEKEELKQHTNDINKLNADNLASKADYKNKLAGTDTNDALDKIDKELDGLKNRLETAKQGKEKVDNSLTGYEDIVKNPEDFAKDPHLVKLTGNERFKEGLKNAAPIVAAAVLLPPVGIGMAINSTVNAVKQARDEAKELVKYKELNDPLKLVGDVKNQSNQSKEEREKTIEALKQLTADLETRRDAINEKIAELKAPLTTKGVAAHSGDEKKQWKKIEELEKKAGALDQTINKMKDDTKGLEDRHKALPAMLASKETKLQQEQKQQQQIKIK